MEGKDELREVEEFFKNMVRLELEILILVIFYQTKNYIKKNTKIF